MSAGRLYSWSFAVIAALSLYGCAAASRSPQPGDLNAILRDVDVQASAVTPISSPSVSAAAEPFSLRERTSESGTSPEPWDLSLDEAIQIALANSTVLRNLGARLIQAPETAATIYTPAVVTSDATSGVEAALSAFDAQLRSDVFYEDNDRVLNNEFVGGGVNFFKQYLLRSDTSLSKRAATGTLFTLRHNIEGDHNNAERNLITDRAWQWNLEGEVRQPLLQGGGLAFNRIAGPGATVGVYNGVVIARLNTDISVAQLEIALRDYLSDVENAYWDLYYAYADLEVKRLARDRSLNTWQLLQARQELPGAEKDKLAQAKEQYFRFEQEVQDALAGRLVMGTRTFNGSGGGTFQGRGGVYVNERRLRLIMGLPINDGRLIRTTSEPTDAPVRFDWNDLVSNALDRRTELRQQRLKIDRMRLELTASRNFLLPRLDAVGRYRYRGLGEALFDSQVTVSGQAEDSGTHEWLMGLSLAYPVGSRQAHAAIRNAQLRLARERAVLDELRRQVIHGISNAVGETDRAYEALRTALNRAQAAREQYDILSSEAHGQVRQFDFNALLDSQRRLAEAEAAANRAAIQYALANKNLNFEMGALLEYFNIHLADQTARRPGLARTPSPSND